MKHQPLINIIAANNRGAMFKLLHPSDTIDTTWEYHVSLIGIKSLHFSCTDQIRKFWPSQTIEPIQVHYYGSHILISTISPSINLNVSSIDPFIDDGYRRIIIEGSRNRETPLLSASCTVLRILSNNLVLLDPMVQECHISGSALP